MTISLYFCFVFSFFFNIIFNGTRNMKHGRKFHFAGTYLFKFILRLEIENNSRYFRGFFSTFKLKSVIFEVYDT